MIRGLEVGVPYSLNGEPLYVARISVTEGATMPVLIAPSSTDDVTAQSVRYAIHKDGTLYEVKSIQRKPVLRVDMLVTAFTVADLVMVDLDDDAQLADLFDAYVGSESQDTLSGAAQAYAEYVDTEAAALLAQVDI